jgi:hypothetical protein
MTKEELEAEWQLLWNAATSIQHRHWPTTGPKTYTRRQKRNNWLKSVSIQRSLSRIKTEIDKLPSSE